MPKDVSIKAVEYHMHMLGYATKAQIGRLYYGIPKTDNERKTFQTKAGARINKLHELGVLDKLDGTPAVYRLKGLRGSGGQHAMLVTDVLIDILRNFPKTKIEREPKIDTSSRPDALMIIKSRFRHFPLILEVAHTEKKESIQDKITDYKNWKADWFVDKGYNHAGVLVIGDIDIDDDCVRCAKHFDRRILDG